MALLAALIVAGIIAAWTYRSRLDEGAVRLAAIARAAGIAALLALLLDPGIVTRLDAPRPIVLLDNSISMHAVGGRATEARRLAASLGDTTAFGELVPGEPAGRSDVAGALAGAIAGGRPVVIVTDGELGDAAMIPSDVLAQAAIRVLARPAVNDVALVHAAAPPRLSTGDTLAIEVDALASGTPPDSVDIEVHDGDRLLMRGTLRFGNARRARARLAVAMPPGIEGERWLTVSRRGAADGEPGDDSRLLRVTVMPTPGVVMIAASPDWDARFLYRALGEVVETPVRGYVQLEAGRWRRMDDLRPVATADVLAAARGADLLAVRGDTTPWRSAGRARLLWPHADSRGDWYLASSGLSPLAGAFAGIDADSLPPATAARPLDPASAADWIGVNARLSRRGAEVPVVGGRSGPGGRSIVFGVDGLYRWGFRGGASDQAWRSLVADAATWLLATPDAAGSSARVIEAVTQRGRAVRFRWSANGAARPIAITLDAGNATRSDTLRFDGAGEASLALPVGRYRYTLEGGGSGTFAVEPYSDELVPSTASVTDRVAEASPAPARRSLREMLWLFAVAIAGFGSEWMLRRRLGLR